MIFPLPYALTDGSAAASIGTHYVSQNEQTASFSPPNGSFGARSNPDAGFVVSR